MTALGRTGHAAAVYILLAGLQRGMPLIILPFISQVMPPAEYGAASMLTASSLLLTTIFAPFEQLVFRAAARGGDEAPAMLRIAGAYCYLVVPVGLAMVAGIVALSVPSFLGVHGRIWGIELLAVGFQPALTYFALPVVQARQDLARFAQLASTSVFLLAASKLLLLLVWQLGVLGWVVSDLISAAVSAAFAIALVRLPRAAVTRSDVRRVVAFAVPLIPHRASFWAINSLSRPAMAAVSTLTQVGLLSLGLNVASIASLLLSEINRAFLPRYSRESFPAPTQQTLPTVKVQLVLAITIPAAVAAALALFGRWVFAADYWPSFALTGVLLVGQAAYGIYLIPTNYVVQAAGTTRAIALASGGGALLMLLLLLLLGHRYGAIGAAFANATGFLAMAVISGSLPRLLRLDIAWRAWRSCWPSVVLGLIALAASVAALGLPVGSEPARLTAVVCLLLVVVALIITFRRGQVRQ